MLSETSNTERQMPCDFTYVQNLKNKTHKAETDSDAENTLGCQVERGGDNGWKRGGTKKLQRSHTDVQGMQTIKL